VSPHDDERPLSKRERERLRRDTRKERQRRMDAAVARRRDARSGSPLRVVGLFLGIVVLLAGITAVFLQVGDDVDSGGLEAARAASGRPVDDDATGKQASPTSTTGDEAPLPGTVTVAVVGDITLGSGDGLPPDHARDMFAAVGPTLRTADVAIGSLQGTLSVGGESHCSGAAAAVCSSYQAPPDNAAALQGAGFDVMNIATQHAFDYGRDGLQQSIGALDRYGIRSAGLRGKVATLDVAGTRVAVVGFAPYGWSNNPRELGDAAALVSEAGNDADIVIVVGGGAPFSHAFAHEAISAGADLVVGSGPDAIYSVERYEDRLAAYSLANFAGFRSFSIEGDHALSAILEVRLSPRGDLLGGRLHAIVLTGPGFPAPDPQQRAVKLVDDLSRNGATAPFRMTADGRFGDVS
jgi:hypothetical protein